MEKFKVASFFTGVGGIDLGLQQTGRFETIYANENDKYPIKIFEANFPITIDARDIQLVNSEEVPAVDLICGGFPCQPFAICGKRQGFDDKKNRGKLFFEMLRIIADKKPRFLLFENVKNLIGHDKGNTFKVIISCLSDLGYYYKYKVLESNKYGNVPQGRERIFIVCFLNKEEYERFEFPEEIPLTTKISDIINFNDKMSDKYYYIQGKYKNNLYERLVEKMKNPDSVYILEGRGLREDLRGLIPTIKATAGIGGHNVPLILTPYGIRKMTPRECYNAQGFPQDFILPKSLSDSRLYKAAGNSVTVPVIKRIAEQILKSIE